MRKILIITLILFAWAAKAQDMHFSQFYATPMFTNPAFTGDFDGTYRLSGVIRNQWNSISSEPFRTIGFGGDINAPLNIKPLGVGLHIAQDQSGVTSLTRQQANLFLAGRFRLGASKDWVVSIGGLFGLSTNRIDYSNVAFDNQYDGVKYDPDLDNGEVLSNSAISWANAGGGFFVKKEFTSRKHIGGGLSMFNLLRPNIAFEGGANAELPIRNNIHLLTSLPFANRWDVMPTLQIMRQRPHTEILAGGSLRYHLKETKLEQESVMLGFWGRPGDAGYVTAGMQLNNLFVGASYDVNLSTLLPATFYRGGWEVTIIYTIETVREKVKRIRQCPDYI